MGCARTVPLLADVTPRAPEEQFRYQSQQQSQQEIVPAPTPGGWQPPAPSPPQALGSPSLPCTLSLVVLPAPGQLHGCQRQDAPALKPRERAMRCFCSSPKFALPPPAAAAPETEPTEPGPLGECLSPLPQSPEGVSSSLLAQLG